MGETIADPVHGTHDIVRDAAWEREVRREVVRAVVDRERRSLPASFIGLAILIAAAIPLPYGGMLAIPLALRLLSLAITRHTTVVLRKRLDENAEIMPPTRRLTAALALAGFSWALLLYPFDMLPEGDPSVTAIRGVVVIGMAMVAVTYGPLRAPMFALVGSFTATLLAILALNAHSASPWLAATVVALAAGIVAYSLGAARQHVSACEMLVDNRRLSEELAEALAQAEYLSQHDPLTGLFNRRAFFGDGEAGVKVGPDTQLLTLDLDHFKAINDEFGHEVGDRVLVATADAMRAVARTLPDDRYRAVRLGGEEFALMLGGVGRAAASGLAEALRLRIERIPERIGLPQLRVTASIGIAECRPGEDLDTVLRRSDLAMYRAKDRGRNCVVGAAA